MPDICIPAGVFVIALLVALVVFAKFLHEYDVAKAASWKEKSRDDH